jgi:hypothetical protein
MAFVVLMAILAIFGLLALAWMKYDDMHPGMPDN